MTWQNPAAWLGALAVVLPIAIHLLGRGHAKVLRFPTLRFFRTSRLLPTRRTRIHDPWLLALRALILLVAAAALAQPLFDRRGHSSDVQRRLVRAIIVDTSASMRGGLDSANRIAARLAAESQDAVTMSTGDISGAIDAAAEWTEHRAGRREVVVISDFPRGVLDRQRLAKIPASIGVRVIRLSHAVSRTATRGSLQMDVGPDAVSARWTASRATPPPLTILAGNSDRSDADAALAAATAVADPAGYDAAHAVAIVLPGYEKRAALLNGPLPRAPWMIELLSHVGPVDARMSDSSARASLLLFCDAPAASVRCATLIANVIRWNTTIPVASEMEPEIVPDAELARWQRAPGPGSDVHRPGDWLTGPSDARWLWAIVLLLIAVETFARRERARAEPDASSVEHERAA